MIAVREVIVVEGRYDKNKLSQIFDAVIIETSGFGIFNDREKLDLLRRLAETRGLIVLTDSDGAGFVIRNYLKGALGGNVKHAYIPDIEGRERRKAAPSSEGLLGVEGMERDVLISALRLAGATMDDENADTVTGAGITKADLYEAGLSGGEGSAEKRRALLRELSLPRKLGANAMLDVLNALVTKERFFELTSRGSDENPPR